MTRQNAWIFIQTMRSTFIRLVIRSHCRRLQYCRMTSLIKVDLIVWIIIHAFGGSSVTSKIQVYLVIVTHARPRESTQRSKLQTSPCKKKISLMSLGCGYLRSEHSQLRCPYSSISALGRPILECLYLVTSRWHLRLCECRDGCLGRQTGR